MHPKELNNSGFQDIFTEMSPFGMGIKTRNFVEFKDFRYSFNGKEKTDEISGSGASYDYGFRIYDPRLSKFLSVDPLYSSFPYKTVYDFAENSPVMGIDMDGGELEPFMILAMKGMFGATAQKVSTDINAGAVKSLKKNAMGAVNTLKLATGHGTNKEYKNFVVGVVAQTLYVNVAVGKDVLAKELAKSKNGALKAVGDGMKVQEKKDADIVDAFKTGNVEKISEVVTDVGILVATTVITDGIINSVKVSEAAVVLEGGDDLYRFDTRTPAQIEEAGGFSPKGTNMDLVDHVFAQGEASGYVATSKDLEALKNVVGDTPGYFYKIKPQATGVDVNSFIPNNIHAAEMEVAVPQTIPWSDITPIVD